jgi:hypothetical protein
MTDDADPEADSSSSPDGTDADPGWPISFMLLVGAGALYLILRLIQIVADVVG